MTLRNSELHISYWSENYDKFLVKNDTRGLLQTIGMFKMFITSIKYCISTVWSSPNIKIEYDHIKRLQITEFNKIIEYMTDEHRLIFKRV